MPLIYRIGSILSAGGGTVFDPIIRFIQFFA